MSDSHISVSVVCPFFNEEAIIQAAVSRMLDNLYQQFPAGDWELILVDDGSSDSSRKTIVRYLEERRETRVRVIGRDINFGRGRALKSGIDAAFGALIVTTEVDCSWGDDIVRRLVDELEAHPETDFVVASVHLPGGGLVNVPASRRALTSIGNVLIRTFFTNLVSMNTGMTRIYRSRVIKPLVTNEDGKEFHLEVLLKLLGLGFRVREIPATITWMDHKLAKVGSAPRKSSTKIANTIKSHLKFIAIAQPVQYFAILAAISLVTGLFMIVAAVWQLYVHEVAVFVAIIGLVMLMFSLMFGGFAVLFHQIREGLIESWKRDYPSPHPPKVRPVIEVFPKQPPEDNP